MPARLLINTQDFDFDLRNLPIRLRDQARLIVHQTATDAEAAIRSQYPVVTGKLRDGLLQKTIDRPMGVRVRLVNVAPHAMLYEYGTEMRQTKLGYNRGRMPAGKIFIPEMIERRRQMIQDGLIPMMEAEGLKVVGD